MSVEAMQKKSAAAANLWTWVVNIYGFNRIYVKVKPLMDALDEANASKAAADESLAAAQATVKRCEDELQALQDKFEAATAEKQEVEEMAEACLEKLGLAETTGRWSGVRERTLGPRDRGDEGVDELPHRRLHGRRGLRVVRRAPSTRRTGRRCGRRRGWRT